MSCEIRIAWRYLLTSPGQTLLSIGAVSAAVCVIVFINSMMLGMRGRIADDFVGKIAHIELTVPEEKAAVFENNENDSIRVARSSPRFVTTGTLQRPERIQELVEAIPEVRATAKMVTGQAFLVRGTRQFGLTIQAADPHEYEEIALLQQFLVGGSYQGINTNEIVIGYILAEEAGVEMGDRVTILSSTGQTESFRVAGIYDSGQDQQDRKLVYTTLAAGQRLFGTKKQVNAVAIKLWDAWDANEVNEYLKTALTVESTSWLDEQVRIKDMIRTQDASRAFLSTLSLLTSIFAIAAVLIVSVKGRTRQIGILKSMGATNEMIIRIFTLQGLILASLGALAGAVLGTATLAFLKTLLIEGRFGQAQPLLPVTIIPEVVLQTMFAAFLGTLLASVLPALQAARVNPVEAINV